MNSTYLPPTYLLTSFTGEKEADEAAVHVLSWRDVRVVGPGQTRLVVRGGRERGWHVPHVAEHVARGNAVISLVGARRLVYVQRAWTRNT